jgi:Ca2+-binding EF-hand superfamily protein
MRLIIAVVLALCTSGCAGLALRAVAAAKRPDATDVFKNADENGDDRITRVEFTQARVKLFAQLDKNSDGYLTKDDTPRHFALFGRDTGRSLKKAMTTLDKNGDGRISRDEFVAGPNPLFDRVDTNRDGVIDAAELAAFHADTAARGQTNSLLK